MAKATKSGKTAVKKSSVKKGSRVLKKKTSSSASSKTLRNKKAKSNTKPVKKKESMEKKSVKKMPVKKGPIKTTSSRTSVQEKTSIKKSTVKKTVTTKETPKAVEVPKVKLEDIKGYSKKDLDHFKQIILEKRDEIIEQLQNLKDQMLDPTTGEYINENSPYSLHMAEQGTDAMEREKTFLYAQRENKFLGYLEDALKRIEAGTYGICIECVEEPQHLCETCPLIPKPRLEAVPHSQLCLPMKQRQEKR